LTRENYEVWMLDFIEGNLTPDEKEEVYSFLAKNPDLKAELEEFESAVISPGEKIIFTNKTQLKKTAPGFEEITRNDYLIIGKKENVLNADEEKEFEVFIRKNPGSLHELTLYGNTVLKPDSKITFPHKNSLKRDVVIPYIPKPNLFRAAAIIIFVLFTSSITWFITTNNHLKENSYTENRKQKSSGKKPEYRPDTKQQKNTVTGYAEKLTTENLNNRFTQTENRKIRTEETPYTITNQNKSLPLTKLQAIGINNVLRPVKINGYEAALNQIMPLYLSCLRNKEFKPVVSPAKNSRNKTTSTGLLAEGVKMINKITGSDISINKKYDKSGEVIAYSFASSNIHINHKVKNKKD